MDRQTDCFALIFLISAMVINTAWGAGAGGVESMDRPSELPLPLPNFTPKNAPEIFSLPPSQTNPQNKPGLKRKIYISHIAIKGNTVIVSESLEKLVGPYQNRNVSVGELEELRQTITKLYQDQGYINSGAIIADGALQGDELTISVVEGKVKEIRVSGQGNLRAGYVKNRLAGDPEKPFNIHELEDRFQVMLSDPLISRMNGQILPGSGFGQGILDVEVARSKPYRLSVYGNNYRPPSIGADAFAANGSLFSPLGLGEILDFTYTISGDSQRYSGGLTFPLTDYGAMAFFRFDEGDSMVGEAPFQSLNIKSLVHNLEGGISQLLINTQAQRLSLGVSFAVRKNVTSVLGQPFSFVTGVPPGQNQATVLRVFQDYLQRFDRHAVAGRSTFNVGVNALGATPGNGDYPSSDFFSWLGQGQYAFRLNDAGTQFLLRGNAQFSNNPLLPLEQIAVGGVSTVRGYSTNTLVRDNGYTISTELHYPLPVYHLFDTPGKLELIPFMDYGVAWDHKTSWQPDAPVNALWSVGMGLQWRHADLSADVFYGYALIKSPQSQGAFDPIQNNGIYFQLKWDVL